MATAAIIAAAVVAAGASAYAASQTPGSVIFPKPAPPPPPPAQPPPPAPTETEIGEGVGQRRRRRAQRFGVQQTLLAASPKLGGGEGSLLTPGTSQRLGG